MKKNPSFSARLLIAPLAILAFHFHPVSAQSLALDTLAVRVLLDENSLDTLPVSAVATIDASQRIVSLDLSGRKIVKLTSEIGSITNLKSLVLSNNLIDSLPAEIWNLGQLVSLDASGNRITRLDAHVAQLSNLIFLSLGRNSLPALPPELFTLPNIEYLLLSGNLLDTLPEGVADLVFLKYLNVSGNRLRTVPGAVAAMNQLDSLDLSGNLMTGLPEVITSLIHPKVGLEDNLLCNLSAQVSAWATGKDPAWQATQICGIAVRPGAAHAGGFVLRAWAESGDIRMEFPASAYSNPQATYEAALLDAQGRTAYRGSLRAGSLRIARTELGSHRGGLWAELRSEGRVLAAVPVLSAK